MFVKKPRCVNCGHVEGWCECYNGPEWELPFGVLLTNQQREQAIEAVDGMIERYKMMAERQREQGRD